MSEDPENRHYLVRTTPELLERGIVGVGWVEFRFCEFTDAESAIQEVIRKWGSIRRWGNQIRRFYAIKEGDLIVAPMPYAVAIGRATGGIFYDDNYRGADRANQRRVEFPRDGECKVIQVPRTSFSEAFQRRLLVRGMTVNDLGQFAAEVQDAFEGAGKGVESGWTRGILESRTKRQQIFRERLLDNIQRGNTNLKTSGRGLEDLISELLKCDGYESRVLPKRRFKGSADADIEASRSDRWAAVKLLVQVKHHQRQTGGHGVNQLKQIPELHPGQFDEHQRILVTSASVSEELRREAEKEDILVMDGDGLVDWISDHIAGLSAQTKDSLGIFEVPTVL